MSDNYTTTRINVERISNGRRNANGHMSLVVFARIDGNLTRLTMAGGCAYSTQDWFNPRFTGAAYANVNIRTRRIGYVRSVEEVEKH